MKNFRKENISKILLIGFFIILNLSFINFAIGASPFGASNITIINTTTASVDLPQSISAQAGNATELNIFGYSVTQSWQGYFGNVTGTIILAGSSESVMYNWSATSPQGEIYASKNESVIWTNVQCFNFSAAGTYLDDSNQKGNTSFYGMNLSALENLYNISSDDVDGINETFTLNDHTRFYTNNLEFSSGECRNTKIFNSSGMGVFDEVLLYSPDNREVIFASIILDNANGFDGATHDFEMLVLENGHYGDAISTPYYFYVELE